MTQEEKEQFDQLQRQLEVAKESADQIRTTLSNTLCRLLEEVRLYRGLFWCLLALTTFAAVLRLLQR